MSVQSEMAKCTVCIPPHVHRPMQPSMRVQQCSTGSGSGFSPLHSISSLPLSVLRTGFGSYEDPSGSKYTGDWKDGMQHGQGVCETADGEQYTGSYVAGLPSGRGVYKFKNGNIYDGEYMDGKICGHGVIRFPDHRRFEGEFRDNKKNGHGRYEGAGALGGLCCDAGMHVRSANRKSRHIVTLELNMPHA
jgi:hypothetical protein